MQSFQIIEMLSKRKIPNSLDVVKIKIKIKIKCLGGQNERVYPKS